MKIVIDIPDNIYDAIKSVQTIVSGQQSGKTLLQILVSSVENGIPLPKGHGRLIDVSDIEWAKHREERNYIDYEVIDWDDIVNAPTIIKAESEEEE